MIKEKLVLAAPVQTRSGYGTHSRAIALALINMDVYDVSIVPIRWGGTPQTALNKEDPNDKKIIDRIVSGQINFQPDIFIHVTIPNEFQVMGKRNIGITAGIETTVCRQEWIEGINRMDLVIATSEHSKNVLLNTKYEKVDQRTNQVVGTIMTTKPVITLFEGINKEVFNPQNPVPQSITEILQSVPEEYCFLFVGHWLQGAVGHDRKDVGGLIKTFLETFMRKASHNKPALILKTGLVGFSISERLEIESRIQDIRGLVQNSDTSRKLPNIYLIHGELTDLEMNGLYNHPKVKSMVTFTKGEGYGLPIAEFATTGKPIIASGWSGQLDFLNPEYAILLNGSIGPVHESAQNEWIIRGSQWFTVDYQKASIVLNDVYEHYDAYLMKSRKMRKYIYDNFSLEMMQNKLKVILENIDSYNTAPKQMTINIPKPDVKFELPKVKKI